MRPISMFDELCRCCLWQWGFVVSLWRSIYCLGKSLGYLRISRGPLVNNSTKWNLVPALEASFGDERWSTGFHLPHCLQTSLGSSLHSIGSFHCPRFPYHSSNALQVYSFPSFPPSILFPWTFPTDPAALIPLLNSSSPIKLFLFPPTRKNHVPPPHTNLFLYT